MKRTDREETPDKPYNSVRELQFWAEFPITKEGRDKRPAPESLCNDTSSIRERLTSELELLQEDVLVPLLLEALPETVNAKYLDLMAQDKTHENDNRRKSAIPAPNTKHSKIATIVNKIANEQLAPLEEKLQAYKQSQRTI